MSRKLMRMRSVIGFAGLAVVLAATTSCGDVVTSSRAPVILSVRSLVPNGGSCCAISTPGTDVATASLGVVMKDVNLTATSNNMVTITRYHVEYSRADGRSEPGVDVPLPFDGVTTATIAGDATGPVTFDLVRQVAKKELPLTQITGSNVVSTIVEVTFFGHDLVGNDVSASGTLLINFKF